MHARFLADTGRDCRHAAPHNILRIGLPRVNHIVNGCTLAEMRQHVFTWLACFDGLRFTGCDPGDVAVFITAKRFVMKIQIELAEFPELISNVLACVGHSSVRADDNLVRFMLVSPRVRFKRHHPAAFVAPFHLIMNCICLFHPLEGMIPEFEAQDFGLARQHIVTNAEPLHRAEDALDVARGNVVREFGCRIVALFDLVKRLSTQPQAFSISIAGC